MGTIGWDLLSAGFLVLGRVDPGRAWQFRRDGRHADEAFGAGAVGGGRGLGRPAWTVRAAVVDVCGGVQAEPAWRCSSSYQGISPGSAPGRLRSRGTGRGKPGGISAS